MLHQLRSLTAFLRPSPQYIAAAGVPKAKADHAIRAACYGLDLVQAARSCMVDPRNPKLGYVKIRVGIDTGSATGYCVSSSRPKYTLVGDAVNVAARMVRIVPWRTLRGEPLPTQRWPGLPCPAPPACLLHRKPRARRTE